MPKPSLKCTQIDTLKLYLTNKSATLENKPSGQSKYTLPNGLIVNVYETGSVVFQGKGANTSIENPIRTLIDSINSSI